VPAIKGGLDLSNGQFAIALLGLEAGAVLALQRLLGCPVLSRLHAMHSLGGVLGAGAGRGEGSQAGRIECPRGKR